MAASDYTHGDMNIAEQSRTFSGFMRVVVWSCAVLAVGLLFLTLHYAIGMAWFTALGVAFVVGVIIGLVLGMKGGWYATLVGLAVLGGAIGVFGLLFDALSAG